MTAIIFVIIIIVNELNLPCGYIYEQIITSFNSASHSKKLSHTARFYKSIITYGNACVSSQYVMTILCEWLTLWCDDYLGAMTSETDSNKYWFNRINNKIWYQQKNRRFSVQNESIIIWKGVIYGAPKGTFTLIK